MQVSVLAQVFSCEFCKTSKNTFCYRTPLLAASVSCEWLLCYSYFTNKNLISINLQSHRKFKISVLKDTKNSQVISIFVNVKEINLNSFCNQYKLKSRNKKPICFRNPTCIDLFLTNSSKNFILTCTAATGLSDFQELVVTALNEISNNDRD